MVKLFSKLIKSINSFVPNDPIVKEDELETKLRSHLENDGFTVSRQVRKNENRYDLICREGNSQVCIEMKLKAEISDIRQFDRYLINFKDGFIVVCWSATFSVRDIFNNVIDQSPIPVSLIELSKKYGLA